MDESVTQPSSRDRLRDAYVTTKHAVRSAGHTCARLPRLPIYARYRPPVHLPGGKLRVYYFHVRKTGGTSLAHAFLSLGAEDPARVERRMRLPPFCTASGDYRFVYQDRPLLRRGHYFFAYGHGPAETVQLPEHTFTVTILRDPIERIVSLYRYLIDPGADEGQAFHSLAYERKWAEAGFMTFLDRVSPEQLQHQLRMFSVAGDVDEAADRILACDCLLFTESLDDGLAHLGSLLDLPLAPRRVRSSTTNFVPTASERARVAELLAPEYQLLARVAQGREGGDS
jgi:hypothetical protein